MSVPIMFWGKYDRAKIDSLACGETCVGSGHIREGIVITTEIHKTDNKIGRVILKHLSEDYLLRNGGTEFN